MAAIHPIIGSGASLALGGTTYEGSNWKVKQITPLNASRPKVDRTHLLSTAPTDGTSVGGREYMPGNLWDLGDMQVEVYWNPHATPPTVSNATYMASASTYTIALTVVSGSSVSGVWTFQGFLIGYSVSGVGVDTEVTATLTFALDGLVTITTAGS